MKTLDNGTLTIKNVGENFVKALVAEREKNGEFKSLRDFVSRMITELNKRSVECLIKSGAFDSFGLYRSQLLAVCEEKVERLNPLELKMNGSPFK